MDGYEPLTKQSVSFTVVNFMDVGSVNLTTDM